MAEEFRVLRPREFHAQLVLKGQRADGRSLEEVREIKLEVDAIRTADASSLVKLGNTSLVCGCVSLVSPNKDVESNEQGDLIKISVDLPPICSSPSTVKFQNSALLLTKTLNDILRDSNCIDSSDFYIDDENTHFVVEIEVICLNHDGSLIDAALVAILAALKSLPLKNKSSTPAVRRLKFNSIPICSSFAIIGGKIICDPNLEEETIAQSTFSIIIDATNGQLSKVNKVGGKSINNEILINCIQLAKTRASKFKEFIDKVEITEGK